MTDGFIKSENLDAVMAESRQWLEEVKNCDDDEQYAHACEIGGQIMDINIWDGSKLSDDNMWHCEAIECFEENGYHTRGYRYQNLWSIPKNFLPKANAEPTGHMTEEQLFQNLYRMVAGTNVTYKQVDSDLDEEGDVTVFFTIHPDLEGD